MVPHTMTDPACLYYQPPADHGPGWRDYLAHPVRAVRWRRRLNRFNAARGYQCFACNPPTWKGV